jgi:predicted AAA+ superfamily ATPase
MFPLDFVEFLHFREVDTAPLLNFRWQPYRRTLYALYKPHYEEYIKYGGFPEVALAGTAEKKVRFLQDVLNSYIELDVKLLADYSVIDDLYRLVSLLASRIGSKLDYSKIGVLLGINRHKIKEYIHLLEKTYFIHLIRPFSKNIDRTISLQQKVYLADTGLVNQLAQLDSGSIFENAIALQLLNTGEVNYFQRRNGQEIDFILDKKIAIEVKETPTPSNLKTLEKRAALLSLENTALVGRYPPGSDFTEFTWGGTIF